MAEFVDKKHAPAPRVRGGSSFSRNSLKTGRSTVNSGSPARSVQRSK